VTVITSAMNKPGNLQHRRILLILVILLVIDHTQGHSDNTKEQHDHSHRGLADFADKNAEISNPLHQNDFVKHKECVDLFTSLFLCYTEGHDGV
jgi:hypothetical protein